MTGRMRFLLVAACALGGQSAAAVASPSVNDIGSTYSNIAEAVFSDAAERAKELDRSIDALLAGPSQETLDVARTAWKAARIPYLQSEGFRFGNKIVDDWIFNLFSTVVIGKVSPQKSNNMKLDPNQLQRLNLHRSVTTFR